MTSRTFQSTDLYPSDTKTYCNNIKKLGYISAYFARKKHDPPLCFGHGKIHGSIVWADDLYFHAKRLIVLFQQSKGLLLTGLGSKVKTEYLSFARTIDNHKNSLFKERVSKVHSISHDGLRDTLLIRDEIHFFKTLRMHRRPKWPDW